MWNFDHYLLRPFSPTYNDCLLYPTTSNNNARFSYSGRSTTSQMSYADEATEHNILAIDYSNQTTDITRLISNSWPKLSGFRCSEKFVLNVDAEPDLPDIPVPETYFGNPNYTASPSRSINTPIPQVTSPEHALTGNPQLSPSPIRMFSSPTIPYIDWGTPEFIDDF